MDPRLNREGTGKQGRGSCRPIIPTHGEYRQACASSARNNEREVRFQNKEISQPLTPRKLKDYSCFQRQNVAGWEEESLSLPQAGALVLALPHSPLSAIFLQIPGAEARPVVARGSSAILVTQPGPKHQSKSHLAVPESAPMNGACPLSKDRTHCSAFGCLV